MKHILKCENCKEYTISEKCPRCDGKAVTPKPAKYSPQDKYAKYRRIAKGMDK
ncbi:ribosome biogenesis protein [Candidatus Woesearchaeota archaeon]|nr:MAG: ribosome biogenesis protein [Candidatus Woesearchaeota archaeon]